MGMIDFNPAVHREGVQLYEIRSVDLENGLTGTTVEESKTPWEQALKTPWYYLVDETDPALTATKQHDEAIIVLRPENPEEAARLALPNGIPPADLHVTLAYLGDVASMTPEQRTAAEDVVRSVALDDEPARALVQFNGVIHFADETDGTSAFALNADSLDLEPLRGKVVAQLAERGLDIIRTHGFTPHLTLAYLAAGEPAPNVTLPTDPIPLVLELWWGDERTGKETSSVQPAVKGGFVTMIKSKVDALREALGLKAGGWQVQPFHKDFALADEGDEWSFEAVDGNTVLDKGGWELYKKVHLVCDTAEGNPPEIKTAYKYPVAKLVNGKPTYFFRAAAAVNSGLGGGARRADIPADAEKKVAVTLRKIYEAFERDPEQVQGEKGGFVTLKDGRVLFLGGGEAGGGGASESNRNKGGVFPGGISGYYEAKDSQGNPVDVDSPNEIGPGQRITLNRGYSEKTPDAVTFNPANPKSAADAALRAGWQIQGTNDAGTYTKLSRIPNTGLPRQMFAQLQTIGDTVAIHIYDTKADGSADSSPSSRRSLFAQNSTAVPNQKSILSDLSRWLRTAAPGPLALAEEKQIATTVAARLSKIKVDPLASQGQGYAFKTLDGNTWWLQFTTNNFIDREGEIFSRKALEDYIARHAGEAVKGEFWYRHVPGTKFGNVVWQALVGNFLVQAGPFDNTPVGCAFKEFLTANPGGHPQVAPHGWGTSHGYYYKPADKAAGVYEWLEIKESTVLPVDVAANVWSPMPLLIMPKEYEMNAREEKELQAIGGDALVQLVKQQAEGRTTTLKQEGVASKSLNDVSEMLQALADSTDDQMIKDEVALIMEAVEAEKQGAESAPEEPVEEVPVEEIEAEETMPEGFAEFSGKLDAQMKELRSQMSTVAGAVKTLATIVSDLKRDDSEKLAEKAAETPAASLRDIAASVVGNQAARVGAKAKLADQGPEINPARPADLPAGLPSFLAGMLGGAENEKH